MKKKEQLHTSTNVKDLNTVNNQSGTKNDEEIKYLVERVPIENTPFAVVGNVETGYCLTIGKWKISEKYKTIEEVLEYPEKNNWKMILTLIGIVIEDMRNDDIEKLIDKNIEERQNGTK